MSEREKDDTYYFSLISFTAPLLTDSLLNRNFQIGIVSAVDRSYLGFCRTGFNNDNGTIGIYEGGNSSTGDMTSILADDLLINYLTELYTSCSVQRCRTLKLLNTL